MKTCRLIGTGNNSRGRTGFLAAVFLGTVCCGDINGQTSISLAWNPSGGGAVSGYALYMGIAGGPFTTRADVGKNTMVTVTGLPAGRTNYFVVAAYDALGLESPVSNEAEFAAPTNQIVPVIPPPEFTPQPLQITDNSAVVISAAGGPNQTWLLQDSTNLTDWSFVFTNATAASLSYKVPVPTGASWRFYRGLTVMGGLNAANMSLALSNGNYSANAVGFVKILAQHGNTLLANPFDSGNNTVAALLPSLPAGSVLYQYTTGSQFASNLFSGGHWSNSRMTLEPGDGGFLYNPGKTTLKLVFAGQVLQGAITNFIPAGYTITSPAIPFPDALATLPGADGDVIQCYAGKWIDYTNVSGGWVGNSRHAPLQINPGGAFFILKQSSADWIQTFLPED